MAHPEYIRKKAIQLRVEKKLTIDEIAERLSLNKTTIYYWVKSIPIPGTEKQTAARKAAARANSERARLKREAAYQRGAEEFEELSKDPTFRDFVCMYIGEGSKRDRNGVAICNSSPAVIKLGNRWITQLSGNPTSYWVQHYEDQNLDEIQEFWADLVGVDPSKITHQRKTNSGNLTGRSWRSKYGVLQVRSSDTYLRARLQAWMDRIETDWE